MSAIQTQDEKIREDLQAAVAQVAKAHGISVNIGEVTLSDGNEVATIEHVSVSGTEAQIEAVMQKFYEAREAHSKLHNKKHYRHRMAVALTVGVGVYSAYHFLKMEAAGKGLEFVLPVIIDKLIFGLGE